jgi:hypothetical protein
MTLTFDLFVFRMQKPATISAVTTPSLIPDTRTTGLIGKSRRKEKIHRRTKIYNLFKLWFGYLLYFRILVDNMAIVGECQVVLTSKDWKDAKLVAGCINFHVNLTCIRGCLETLEQVEVLFAFKNRLLTTITQSSCPVKNIMCHASFNLKCFGLSTASLHCAHNIVTFDNVFTPRCRNCLFTQLASSSTLSNDM